jgi:hypothetical protein
MPPASNVRREMPAEPDLIMFVMAFLARDAFATVPDSFAS